MTLGAGLPAHCSGFGNALFGNRDAFAPGGGEI